MAYAETESVALTTDGSGDCTAYTTKLFTGVVRAVIYTKTNFDNGVDFVVTGETTGQIIWDADDVNASTVACPKQATHLNTTGAAATYDGTRAALADIVVVNERLKIVVASGGAAKTGAIRVVVG